MTRSTKGLPLKTREKLKKLADLNHLIRERKESGDDVSTLESHKSQIIDQVKEEIVENDKKQTE